MGRYGKLVKKGACGFTVMGFPCNQFGLQEPGDTPEEILNGIKYVRPGNGFVPAFPMFEKGDVNGAKENPMYTHLKVRTQGFYFRCIFTLVFRITLIKYNHILLNDLSRAQINIPWPGFKTDFKK
jgi:glutathione peroxidase-family protein